MNTLLNDSFSVFFIPFKADIDLVETLENSSYWNQSHIRPESSFFFPHVNDFFAANLNDELELDRNQLLIYELRSQNLNQDEKESLYLYNQFFKRVHSLKNEEKSISFKLVHESGLLSPKIFYLPLSRILIFTFAVELTESNSTLSDLIETNYRIRIYKSGQIPNFSTKKRDHPKAIEGEKKIYDSLSDLSPSLPFEEISEFNWNLPFMINYLLADLKDHCLELASNRLQAFVYASLSDQIEEEELERQFFRMRRLYNQNYQPPLNDKSAGKEVTQTFKQILYGASLEGAAILVLKDEKSFLKNYRNTVLNRTLWSYILAYHQRFALIGMALETNKLFSGNYQPETHEISFLLERISLLQLNCMFSEVSNYSQQNDFYYLALKNLEIDSLFGEVKEEVEEINKILISKWHDQELIHQKEEDAKAKKFQRKVEILLAILIVPQIWLALLSTNITKWQLLFDSSYTLVNVLSGLLGVGILAIAFRFLFSKK